MQPSSAAAPQSDLLAPHVALGHRRLSLVFHSRTQPLVFDQRITYTPHNMVNCIAITSARPDISRRVVCEAPPGGTKEWDKAQPPEATDYMRIDCSNRGKVDNTTIQR